MYPACSFRLYPSLRSIQGSFFFIDAATPEIYTLSLHDALPITGAEVTLTDGSHITLLVETPQGYANLCRLLTTAHAGTRPKPTEPVPPALDRHLLASHH